MQSNPPICFGEVPFAPHNISTGRLYVLLVSVAVLIKYPSYEDVALQALNKLIKSNSPVDMVSLPFISAGSVGCESRRGANTWFVESHLACPAHCKGVHLMKHLTSCRSGSHSFCKPSHM